MDLESLKKDLKPKFNKLWKEITMKLQLDIKPEDLLSFDKMIAMPAIKVMYIIGLICIAVSSLVYIFDGTILGFFAGIAGVVVGIVIWRIICESAILLFGIYDRLGDIRLALIKNAPEKKAGTVNTTTKNQPVAAKTPHKTVKAKK